jgi:hypothetical protein
VPRRYESWKRANHIPELLSRIGGFAVAPEVKHWPSSPLEAFAIRIALFECHPEFNFAGISARDHRSGEGSEDAPPDYRQGGGPIGKKRIRRPYLANAFKGDYIAHDIIGVVRQCGEIHGIAPAEFQQCAQLLLGALLVLPNRKNAKERRMSRPPRHKIAGRIKDREFGYSRNAFSVKIRCLGLNDITLQDGEPVV